MPWNNQVFSSLVCKELLFGQNVTYFRLKEVFRPASHPTEQAPSETCKHNFRKLQLLYYHTVNMKGQQLGIG